MGLVSLKINKLRPVTFITVSFFFFLIESFLYKDLAMEDERGLDPATGLSLP